MSIAVFNAGSSSLKFGAFDDRSHPLASGSLEWGKHNERARLSVTLPTGEAQTRELDVADMRAATACALEVLRQDGATGTINAVGQRVVHGGTKFQSSVRIDKSVRMELERLCELAPLHNPPALEAIDAIEAALPGVPQVAAFDTAFYADLAPAQIVYPVPYKWYEDWGIRRFGFHGLSHQYCSLRAEELVEGSTSAAAASAQNAPRQPQATASKLRVVICHLGSGCSATATRGNSALATTMGFTPMDGLMMGTRSGSLDPGIILHLSEQHGLSAAELERVLNHEAGLLGVSGVSSDYRKVEQAARDGNERARLALEIFALRVRQAVGALAVTLGGIDALVFTAGVGEHAAELRADVCRGLACLGVSLDPSKNANARADADVTAGDGARVLIIHTREELMIARAMQQIIAPS